MGLLYTETHFYSLKVSCLCVSYWYQCISNVDIKKIFLTVWVGQQYFVEKTVFN